MAPAKAAGCDDERFPMTQTDACGHQPCGKPPAEDAPEIQGNPSHNVDGSSEKRSKAHWYTSLRCRRDNPASFGNL